MAEEIRTWPLDWKYTETYSADQVFTCQMKRTMDESLALKS